MPNNNSILNAIGLCKKAGKLVIGAESIDSAQATGTLKLIVVANDAAERTLRRATYHNVRNGIPLARLELTKADIGIILGGRERAIVGITDDGLAGMLLKRIT